MLYYFYARRSHLHFLGRCQTIEIQVFICSFLSVTMPSRIALVPAFTPVHASFLPFVFFYRQKPISVRIHRQPNIWVHSITTLCFYHTILLPCKGITQQVFRVLTLGFAVSQLCFYLCFLYRQKPIRQISTENLTPGFTVNQLCFYTLITHQVLTIPDSNTWIHSVPTLCITISFNGILPALVTSLLKLKDISHSMNAVTK